MILFWDPRNPERTDIFLSHLAVISPERKYLWSGFSSKMSDNEHPLSVLGNPEVLTVKHLPLDIIPKFIQCGEDNSESSPFVVIKDPYRDSVGLGFRYNTPVGPLNLEFGWKLDRKEGEEPWRFHLSIGAF